MEPGLERSGREANPTYAAVQLSSHANHNGHLVDWSNQMQTATSQTVGLH
jgi:hypothetical protein